MDGHIAYDEASGHAVIGEEGVVDRLGGLSCSLLPQGGIPSAR